MILIDLLKCTTTVPLLLTGALLLGIGGSAMPDETTNGQVEMRMPWKYEAKSNFIKNWLVCGEFHSEAGSVNQDQVLDYLKEQGGVTRIVPVVGMKHTRPDGSEAEWKPFDAQDNGYLDFLKAFEGRPTEHGVGYAYTTISRAKAGKAVLSIGSDDGVRVWVNGKLVHSALKPRGAMPDDDLVEIELNEGENRILAAVDNNKWGWGLYARVLEPYQAELIPQNQFKPSIALDESSAAKLVVSTDTRRGYPDSPVEVQVLAAGGRVAASKSVRRGDRASFDTSGWKDGAYDISFKRITGDGTPEFKHELWYKGDELAAAKQLVEDAKKADPSSSFGIVQTMLAQMVEDRLGEDLKTGKTGKLPSVTSALLEYEELLLERSGKTGGVRPSGMVRLAYRDEIDDSPQLCMAYLPRDYTPAKKWPVIVILHGYNPENPVYVRWWGVDMRHDDAADRYNAIIVRPLGRYNTGFQGIGERDVLRCIELAKKRFSVDDDRVYLNGLSMGGGGTWYVGSRNPDLFAAIAPGLGGWDYRLNMNQSVTKSCTPIENYFLEAVSSFAQAEQLLNTPIFVVHGDQDQAVSVEQSRYAVKMLQRWGYDIRYHEYVGFKHQELGSEEQFPWLLSHKRETNPRHIRIRSADLSSARSHWFAVQQREHPFQMITADAEVTGPNQIKIQTENALEVVLSLKQPLVDPNKPVMVNWNDEIPAPQKPNRDGKIVLRASRYNPGPLVKKPALEGRLRDIANTPFALVTGTISKDLAIRKLCQAKTDLWIKSWQQYQHATPRNFKDTEITEADMAKYSLILVGGPDDNLVTQKLIDKLPIKLSSDEVVIGGKAFSVKDVQVQMIYPNPLNPDRYINLIAGTSARGLSYQFDRIDVLEYCDFAVLDGRLPNNEEGRSFGKVALVSGCFDYSWRYNENYVQTGDPEVREKCAEQTPSESLPM